MVKKSAFRYVKKTKLSDTIKPSILVLKPDYIYKTNSKPYYIKDSRKLSDWDKDSIRYSKSEFLQYISDSIIIENFFEYFVKELKIIGYNVFFEDSFDNFLRIKSTAYILNFAQIELEEFLYKDRRSEVFDSTTFYEDFDVNAVNFNIWVELTEMNGDKGMKILFCDYFSSDIIEGKFKRNLFSGKVRYVYKRKNMLLKLIYQMVKDAGKSNASYLFDFFMNEYLNNVYKEKTLKYYHYDQEKNKIFKEKNKRYFIVKQ